MINYLNIAQKWCRVELRNCDTINCKGSTSFCTWDTSRPFEKPRFSPPLLRPPALGSSCFINNPLLALITNPLNQELTMSHTSRSLSIHHYSLFQNLHLLQSLRFSNSNFFFTSFISHTKIIFFFFPIKYFYSWNFWFFYLEFCFCFQMFIYLFIYTNFFFNFGF